MTVDAVGVREGYTLEATALLPKPGEDKGSIPVTATGPDKTASNSKSVPSQPLVKDPSP